ncbi:response regulator [Derxia gummosa]|uniref:Response regulator n=1 Tax=Derxia gummosa DSM 723 TaxID=1121388 RepID=A0A8B6X1A9_9BURK|nr:response regulator [Derxia gummosa]
MTPSNSNDQPADDGERFFTTAEAAEQLGLSIGSVKLMVDRGELAAWKTAGGHRRISAQSLAAWRQRSARNAASAPGRMRILLVEDDAPTRRLFERKVAQWKFDVDLLAVGDGIEALMKLSQWQPDLLVTDLVMPHMDGFAMLRRLRAAREYDAVDLVVITGLDASAIAERGGLPADALLLYKPIAWDRLHGFIEARISARLRRL